jgi:two-component system, chemotaxis family, sensor kinase Cph1
MNESDKNSPTYMVEPEKEYIYIPNEIQRFGFLLAVNKDNLQIVQCSTNAVDFIGITHQDLLEQDLASLIDDRIIDKIRYSIKQNEPNFTTLNPIKLGFKHLEDKFKAVLHLSEDVLVIEVEPAIYEDFSYSDFYNNINIIITEFNGTKDMKSLCQVATEQVKRITSHSRVMIYQFDKDWNGKIVAECKEAELASFLGFSFPARDMPAQIRQLYSTNLTRIIPDVNYQAVELVPVINPITNRYLDLSKSFLRSALPEYLEYLQNMGVTATLTVSVIVENKLWGFIICHHAKPKFTDYRLRTVIEHIAKIFAYHLHLLDDIEDYKHIIERKNKEKELIKQFFKDDDLFLTLSQNADLLLELNSASGVAILYENNFYQTGIVPEEAFINELFDWLSIYHTEEIFYTDALSTHFSPSLAHKSTASGILAIRLTKNKKNFIIWFKPEVVQTVTWHGKTNGKTIAKSAKEGKEQTPRKSFEKWEKEVYAQSAPWEKAEVQMAQNIYKSILELLSSHTTHLQQQKTALEAQVNERTIEILTIYEELQANNEEIRASNEQLMDSLDKIDLLNHDLQHAQRKLKAIFDSTKQVHFLIDRDYKVLFFNEAARQDGWTYQAALLKEGDNLLDYMGGDTASQIKFKEQVKRAFAGEIFEVEEEVTYSSEPSIWFKTEFYPVNEQGNIIGIALNITNIDRLKKSEKLIKAQNEQLIEIAFIQSHKVRRPVATILGLVAIFNKDDLADEFNGLVLDKLVLATEELDEVIHSILGATYRIEEKKLT